MLQVGTVPGSMRTVALRMAYLALRLYVILLTASRHRQVYVYTGALCASGS